MTRDSTQWNCLFLTGVACVGKTTVGRKLARLLRVNFFDLDHEVERFFGASIAQLQSRWVTAYSYRLEAAKALTHLLSVPESQESVIAMPPSGLMTPYLRIIRKSGGIAVVIADTPENILERITFYDTESRLIEKTLTGDEKPLYLQQIKKDITYFRKSYARAHLRVDISDLTPTDAAYRVKEAIEAYTGLQTGSRKSEDADTRGFR